MSWYLVVKTEDKNAKNIILTALEESEVTTSKNQPNRLNYKDIRFGCFLDVTELAKNVYELGHGGFGQNTIKPSKEKSDIFSFGFDERVRKSFSKIGKELNFQFVLSWNPEESTYHKLFSKAPIKADMEKNFFHEEQNYSL